MDFSVENSPWYRRAFVTVVVTILLVSCVARWRLETIAPMKKNVATTSFSAQQAKDLLRQILGDQKPHPVDSSANDAVRAHIELILDKLGYDVHIQDTTSCRNVQLQTCARVRNIIAVDKGSAPGKSILLSAHYDSVGAGPGASDDGSGVAVLLEAARLLKQRSQSRNTVTFLFTEGEEAGLLGAQAFITQSSLAKNVAFAINIEARGTAGQSALFETGSGSGWLIDHYALSSRHPFANSLVTTLYKLMPNDTDLSVFKAVGLQGLNFAYGENFAYYHTPDDNLQALDLGSLQQQGDNAYDLLATLLNADLPTDASTGGRVYTDVFGLAVVRWSTATGVAIAVALSIIFALIVWCFNKRFHYRASDVIRGLFCFPVVILVGGLTAYILTVVMSLIHGNGPPWHSNGLSNRLLLWSTVLLSAISAERMLCRKVRPLGLWVGICIAWLLVSVLSAALAPGVSYLFIIPSIALVVLACLSLFLVKQANEKLLLLFVLPSIVAFVVTLPAVFLVEIMIGFNTLLGTIGMGALLGLSATFVTPLMVAGVASKSHRISAYAALAVASISAILSVQATAYTKAAPQPLNILYLQKADGGAYLLAGTPSSPPPASVLKTMGSHVTIKQPLPWTNTRFYAEELPSAKLTGANLTVVSQSAIGGGRKVLAGINAEASTEGVYLFIPKSAALISIETDGQIMDYRGKLSELGEYKVFACRGRSCNGRRLELSFDSKTPVSILVAEVAAAPDVAKDAIAARTDSFVPNNDGDQSFILSQSQL